MNKYIALSLALLIGAQHAMATEDADKIIVFSRKNGVSDEILSPTYEKLNQLTSKQRQEMNTILRDLNEYCIRNDEVPAQYITYYLNTFLAGEPALILGSGRREIIFKVQQPEDPKIE